MFQPEIFNDWFGENASSSAVFFTSNRFFHFGLGATIAYLVEKKYLMELPIFVSIVVQLAFILPGVNYLFGNHFYSIAPERIINGLISAGLILMAITRYSLFPFEIATLKYFGKISFGIYIFHMFALRVSFKLLSEFGFNTKYIAFRILFPLLSTVIALLLASISYEYLEKRFLELKKRYK
jgi:peptidoglycan/LPS O-acetylase OafA/YrhL